MGKDEDGAPANYGNCLRCGEPLDAVGVEEFRVGGTSGGWNFIFGKWAELSEGMLEMEILACPKCRKVELRVPGEEPAPR